MILEDALDYKYKDDPIRGNWVTRGPNWFDVEIVEDDGTGHARKSATQLSEAEVHAAIDEWIAAKTADPTLEGPPEGIPEPPAEE